MKGGTGGREGGGGRESDRERGGGEREGSADFTVSDLIRWTLLIPEVTFPPPLSSVSSALETFPATHHHTPIKGQSIRSTTGMKRAEKSFRLFPMSTFYPPLSEQ